MSTKSCSGVRDLRALQRWRARQQDIRDRFRSVIDDIKRIAPPTGYRAELTRTVEKRTDHPDGTRTCTSTKKRKMVWVDEKDKDREWARDKTSNICWTQRLTGEKAPFVNPSWTSGQNDIRWWAWNVVQNIEAVEKAIDEK